MMRKFTASLGALALLAMLATAPGCGSACVAPGGRIRADLIATPDLNDAGQGPQHVRFQVWGVRDLAMYESADAAALAKDNAFEVSGMGRVFPTDSAWIKPGSSRQVAISIEAENQYTHVAIAVGYPDSVPDKSARKAIVPIDCGDHPGYRSADGSHFVSFTLGKNSVAVTRTAAED